MEESGSIHFQVEVQASGHVSKFEVAQFRVRSFEQTTDGREANGNSNSELTDWFSMIQGNQTWQIALGQLQKQPLYILQIPDFGVILASFSISATQVGVSGYGSGLYGIAPYGT